MYSLVNTSKGNSNIYHTDEETTKKCKLTLSDFLNFFLFIMKNLKPKEKQQNNAMNLCIILPRFIFVNSLPLLSE